MSFEEAKRIFLNRGFVDVDGGTIFDGDKWRQACVVISDFLKDITEFDRPIKALLDGYNKGIEVLDKIRAEIVPLKDYDKQYLYRRTLEIIDKYKAESEA